MQIMHARESVNNNNKRVRGSCHHWFFRHHRFRHFFTLFMLHSHAIKMLINFVRMDVKLSTDLMFL